MPKRIIITKAIYPSVEEQQIHDSYRIALRYPSRSEAFAEPSSVVVNISASSLLASRTRYIYLGLLHCRGFVINLHEHFGRFPATNSHQTPHANPFSYVPTQEDGIFHTSHGTRLYTTLYDLSVSNRSANTPMKMKNR